MPVEELNRLELEFLNYNQFNIYVSLEELQQYGDQLLMHSIREQQLLVKKEKLLLDHQQQQPIYYKKTTTNPL